MPELWVIDGAAKIRILGPRDALDRLEVPAAAAAGRVAPDEVLWLGDPGTAAELEEAAQAQVADLGNRALVVDHSDGWALLTLVGEGDEEVFARLSDLRLPPDRRGFVQGQVAQCPAKVYVRPGRLDILVGSDLAWFVRERLAHVGHALGLSEAGPPAAAPVSGAAGVAA